MLLRLEKTSPRGNEARGAHDVHQEANCVRDREPDDVGVLLHECHISAVPAEVQETRSEDSQTGRIDSDSNKDYVLIDSYA